MPFLCLRSLLFLSLSISSDLPKRWRIHRDLSRSWGSGRPYASWLPGWLPSMLGTRLWRLASSGLRYWHSLSSCDTASRLSLEASVSTWDCYHSLFISWRVCSSLQVRDRIGFSYQGPLDPSKRMCFCHCQCSIFLGFFYHSSQFSFLDLLAMEWLARLLQHQLMEQFVCGEFLHWAAVDRKLCGTWN